MTTLGILDPTQLSEIPGVTPVRVSDLLLLRDLPGPTGDLVLPTGQRVSPVTRETTTDYGAALDRWKVEELQNKYITAMTNEDMGEFWKLASARDLLAGTSTICLTSPGTGEVTSEIRVPGTSAGTARIGVLWSDDSGSMMESEVTVVIPDTRTVFLGSGDVIVECTGRLIRVIPGSHHVRECVIRHCYYEYGTLV